MIVARRQRELQLAKFSLIHWKYYERNIQGLVRHSKTNALSLFKSLKKLQLEEVQLLAERYYKSENQSNYDRFSGQYQTVIPVSYKNIAETTNGSEKAIQNELRAIERKLGFFIIQYHEEIEREEREKYADKFNHAKMERSL